VTRFVLDASVAVAWIAASPADPYAAFVKTYFQNGGRALVPLIWHSEVANALLMLERRNALTRLEVESGFIDLQAFQASSVDLDETLLELRLMANLARTYQLTVYAALYLDSAHRNRLPLATLDQSMRTAARKAGIELLK
jgi:predicted nucleic acid-binding protein